MKDFAERHPGGSHLVLNLAGQDATESYEEVHAVSLVQEQLGEKAIMGRVDPITIPKLEKKKNVQQDSTKAPPLRNMINLEVFPFSLLFPTL